MRRKHPVGDPRIQPRKVLLNPEMLHQNETELIITTRHPDKNTK